jgi:hypothetical protein
MHASRLANKTASKRGLELFLCSKMQDGKDTLLELANVKLNCKYLISSI